MLENWFKKKTEAAENVERRALQDELKGLEGALFELRGFAMRVATTGNLETSQEMVEGKGDIIGAEKELKKRIEEIKQSLAQLN